jgi:hypothetical protein
MEDATRRNNQNLILRVAGVLASLAAVLIAWSFLDPPHNRLPVARLVGQMFGTFAFIAFNYVVSTSSSSGVGTCLAGPAGVSSAGTSPGPDGPP